MVSHDEMKNVKNVNENTNKIALNELLMKNEANHETQNGRLEAIKEKTCLWITSPVIPMMSKTLTDRMKWVLNHQVKICAVFHSKDDPLYNILKDGNMFENCIFVDLHSENAGQLIFDQIKKDNITIHSVFSPYEQCQTICGCVATALEIPMANPESAYFVARSKNVTRKVCQEAGIPMPKAALCKTFEEVEQALEDIGYPAIMKPSSGAGSAGVHKITCKEEGIKAFHIIIEDIKSNWALSWNPGCDSACLIEQFLVGDEFDVDMLVWDKKIVYAASVDNWPCLSDHFLETGSNQPSLYPREKTEILEKYALDCVLACGFNCGCFHVECIYTDQGPMLVEVNARQGGGSNQEFNMEINQVDIFENFFISTFGIPINPPVKPSGKAMADYSFTCAKTGILTDTKPLDDLANLPNVTRATTFVKPGQKVTGFDTGFPMWLGEVLVKRDSPQECIDMIQGIVEQLRLDIVTDDEAANKITLEGNKKSEEDKKA